MVAVPAQSATFADTMTVGALAGLLGIFHAITGLAVLLAAQARTLIGRTRTDMPVGRRGGFENVIAVFYEDRVDLHNSGEFRRRVGELLESHPLSAVSYRRTDVAVDTRLTIAEVEWSVNGWFERDLRSAMEPLEIATDRVPAALPDPKPQGHQ